MPMAESLDLITIIVQHKDEKKALDVLRKLQAPGATYFYGRGTGVRQRIGLLGNLIEAEKLVILTAVPPAMTEPIIHGLTQALSLHEPGNGFICVQKVQQVVGYV